MKVLFNHNSQINNYKQTEIIKPAVSVGADKSFEIPNEGLTLAHFPNITFRAGMNPDAKFLLNQASWLRCAYSGKRMLPLSEATNIYKKLERRPNAMSAINLLVQYEKYMHEIESDIFEIFRDAQYKGKRDFQNILQELQPEALKRLKEKQFATLKSTDSIIDSTSEPVAECLREIRDGAFQKIENDDFTRKGLLKKIKKVKATGDDLEKVIRIYRAWYGISRSTRDIDAFIVQYAKQPHLAIAKRLISTSVASIEHIKPDSNNGGDELANYLLVASRFNNDRLTMPLDEYIELNSDIDIRGNIQRYIDVIIKDIHSDRSAFKNESWYPVAIKENIAKQTHETYEPDVSMLRLTKAQKRENICVQRLGDVYKLLKK